MDEAERCTHIGYIYFARMIASGTPGSLKELPEVTPPGLDRYRVICDRQPQAMAFIGSLDYVRDATIFGDSLHVLAQEGTGDQLKAALVERTFKDVHVDSIPPSLEDVFVTVTRTMDEARNV
jgi:hypothetical protein